MDVSIGNASRIRDVNVAFSAVQGHVDFVDVLDRQLFLVSGGVKSVFAVYEPSMVFKDVCVLNNRTDEYAVYHLPLFPEVKCLSPQADVTPDRSFVRRLVLEPPPPHRGVYKVAGLLTDVVVVRLDMAESLLRRSVGKLCMEPVDIRPVAEPGSAAVAAGKAAGDSTDWMDDWSVWRLT